MQIRELRRSFGWTQAELAAEIKASVRTISRWEGLGLHHTDKRVLSPYRMHLAALVWHLTHGEKSWTKCSQ